MVLCSGLALMCSEPYVTHNSRKGTSLVRWGWVVRPRKAWHRRSANRLAIKHQPAHSIAYPLIVKYKLPNFVWKLFALPLALLTAHLLALALRSSSPRCLDRIGGGTEFVGCNVGDRRGLASGVCRVSRSSGQLSCCGIGVACCRACLSHRDFAACPRPSLLHRTAGPRIQGLDRLEERQYVLSAFSRPYCKQVVIGITQSASAAYSNEPRIAGLGKYHSIYYTT